MAQPNDKDRALVKKRIDKHAKALLEDGSPKRKMDDAKVKALFRDAVRKKWMYCPNKLHFLETNRVEDTRPHTRTKWVWECSKCGDWVPNKHFDVDHTVGETEFTDWTKADEYAAKMLDVGKGDLQILCNDKSKNNCHSTKSRAENLGLDWTTEEGWNATRLEQRYTRIMKSNARGQRDFLLGNGVTPGKNKEIRGQQVREVLKLET